MHILDHIPFTLGTSRILVIWRLTLLTGTLSENYKSRILLLLPAMTR